MTEPGAVWVGLLDLDDDLSVIGTNGSVRADHFRARILIRMHRAPIGYVWVPVRPEDTLTSRARAAALDALAEPLHRHAQWDNSADTSSGPARVAAQVACPRHFPSSGETGVSVVVCTRDRTEELAECLRALQRATYDPLEILVVDNAPTDTATRELVTALAREDSRIRYTFASRPGLSHARNHGLAHARFDLVAFTDDDTLADQGWPSAIAAGFTADPEAVCVTGLVASRSMDTGPERYFEARYSWGEVFEPRRYDLTVHRYPSRLFPFSAGIFGTGANFAVRREAVASVGNFDPLLGAGSPGRGGEDLDMFLRLILAGGRIFYLPAAFVWHRHRADTHALSAQIYSYGHGLGAYLAKHLHNRDMRAAMLGHGLRQSNVVLGRMHRASQLSHLGGDGRRLALTEARGVIIGALRYRWAARRASNPVSGVS